VDNLLKGVNLYLIGMMGAGKSTVGRILARELGYRFVDTDALIERVAGMSVSEIFAERGEEGFRELEAQVLGEVAAYKNLAVATGGGIVLRRHNWSYLQHGIVVWLDVPAELLMARLQGDTTRPLLRNPDPKGKLQQLLEERQSLYAQADVRVSVGEGETPQQVAARVIEGVRKVLRPEVTGAVESN
jgi:shikimate kinase